ncbi:MAG TPA: hypothetical protein VHI77_10540 [Solirubrobacterales bacterium]|jgi:hypothetical protein|nr:hypothetical protein [Solirubrobacterales bacterium]
MCQYVQIYVHLPKIPREKPSSRRIINGYLLRHRSALCGATPTGSLDEPWPIALAKMPGGKVEEADRQLGRPPRTG